jgi:hypothetical protein
MTPTTRRVRGKGSLGDAKAAKIPKQNRRLIDDNI